MKSGASLRERQAAVIRDAILDALADRLDHDDPDDIAMPQVAAAAGISLRTLYRYFPTREAMFDAVGDHVVARLGLPRQIEGADDIAPVFLESARRGAQSPRLMRALLWTRLGRRARSSHRRRRVEARRREGAIVYLCSLSAWITVSEEGGLSAEDAQLGIAWAIRALVSELRQENQMAGEPPSQPQGRTP